MSEPSTEYRSQDPDRSQAFVHSQDIVRIAKLQIRFATLQLLQLLNS